VSYARCDGSAHTTEGDITAVSHLAREQIGNCGKLAAEEREKDSTFAPLLQATVPGYGGKKTWSVPTCTLHRLCYVHTTVANRQPFCCPGKTRDRRDQPCSGSRNATRASSGRNHVGFKIFVGRDRPVVMTSFPIDWLIRRRGVHGIRVHYPREHGGLLLYVFYHNCQSPQDTLMFQTLQHSHSNI